MARTTQQTGEDLIEEETREEQPSPQPVRSMFVDDAAAVDSDDDTDEDESDEAPKKQAIDDLRCCTVCCTISEGRCTV